MSSATPSSPGNRGPEEVRGTWDDVNRRLVGAMLALDLHDSLVVAEKAEPPRRGLFGRKPPAQRRRFVQVTAAQTVLIAECQPLTEEHETALLRQGWEKPWSPEMTTYQREAPLAGAPKLAVAMVKALQLLGCEVAELDVELKREEPG
jgi:hypothetical protein